MANQHLRVIYDTLQSIRHTRRAIQRDPGFQKSPELERLTALESQCRLLLLACQTRRISFEKTTQPTPAANHVRSAIRRDETLSNRSSHSRDRRRSLAAKSCARGHSKADRGGANARRWRA